MIKKKTKKLLGSEKTKIVAKSDEGHQSPDVIDKKVVLVTKQGLEQLKEELETLSKVRRKEVAERIKEAISYGDLSENSEYEDAKNEQAFIEGRILELEEKIKHAQIISDKKAKSARTVQVGTTVVIKNLKKSEEAEEYTIVGSTESDPINNRISNESPLGRALLDKQAGDVVDFLSPGGIMKFKIVKMK